jgi:hypothetical protein
MIQHFWNKIGPSPMRLTTRPLCIATVGSRRSLLVRAGHPTEVDEVGGEDRCEFPAPGHAPQPKVGATAGLVRMNSVSKS